MANNPTLGHQLGQQQQLRQQMLAPHLQLTMQLLPLNAGQLNAYLLQQLQHNPLLSWRSSAASTQSAFDVALATQQQQSNLTDHLLQQLALEQTSARQHEYAEIIIDALDSDGYLRVPFSELNKQTDNTFPDESGWRQALALVQAFEPTGVGARNLVECLRLQLEQNFPVDKLQKLAIELVNDHLQELAKPDAAIMAMQLDAETQDVHQAIALIHSLTPRPGQVFDSGPTNYIHPDVRFIRALDRAGQHYYQAELIHPFSSSLQISGAGTARQQREAKALLSALGLREQSMLRVGEFLAAYQVDFLEYGISAIRPLSRLQVAEQLQLHPSTITRTLQAKYADSPRGIIPLHDFFSVALPGKTSNPQHRAVTGDPPAAAAAIARLQELIDAENPQRPLSDARLCQLLHQSGFPVARRTVVKYRQRLGIENSRKRREL